MPDRLDHVTIPLTRKSVELPWDSREKLLDEMKGLEGATHTVRAFVAVGASAPVRLEGSDKTLLVRVIDAWIQNVGKDNLPAGVFELRNSLIDDLHDTLA